MRCSARCWPTSPRPLKARPAANSRARRAARPLGVVVGGSLSHGLEVMLDPHTVLEGLAVGRYVVIHGQTRKRFFGMVTDLSLGATQPDLARHPPAAADAESADGVRGTPASR